MDIKKKDTPKMTRLIIEEISLFIQYGVNEKDRTVAIDIVKKFENNSLALQVLKDFYSRLPKFRDEAVCKITKIVSRQGMYLMGVSTRSHEYLYFYNGEKSFYLGEKKDGIGETEVLSFFGYSSNDDFLKQQLSPQYSDDFHKEKTGNVFCPACSVAEGEVHLLGCPVEVCPWCEGQLSYCNCRFDQMGLENIETDADLDRLEILLNNKGRIPFRREAAPAYPDGGESH